MTHLARWAVRAGTAAGITLVLWAVAWLSSTVPSVVALSTNVHGLNLADYSVTQLRHLAPLSSQIIQDTQRDRGVTGARPSASPTPNPTSSPGPVPTPTPSVRPTPSATPLPSLPPLPTPTVPPVATPTPTVPPLPTPTLPPPPPIP